MKLKLKPTYHQEFLTTQTGLTFYREHNQFGKPENVVDVDFESDKETRMLYEQGTLISVNEESKTSDSDEKSSEQPKMKDTIISDVPKENVVNEKVGKENTEKVKDTLQSLEDNEENGTTTQPKE